MEPEKRKLGQSLIVWRISNQSADERRSASLSTIFPAAVQASAVVMRYNPLIKQNSLSRSFEDLNESVSPNANR